MYVFSRKLIAIALICFLGWKVITSWNSFTRAHMSREFDDCSTCLMPEAIGDGGICTMPEPVAPGQPPKITLTPDTMPDIKLSGATLKPLAEFSAFGKVRMKQNVGRGSLKKISLTNMLLGWKEVAPSDVIEILERPKTTVTVRTVKDCRGNTQTYNYTHTVTPSANNVNIAQVYFIPSSLEVAEAINNVKKDDNIHVNGWVVNVNTHDGSEWKSHTDKNSYYFVYTCRVMVSQQ